MIERYLHAELISGIDGITANPDILKALFEDFYGLEYGELVAIQKYWTAKKPTVIHNYPRTDAKFPLYSIVLESEGEEKMYLGDDAGMITDEEDPEYGTDIRSAFWRHDYKIFTMTEHPDVTLYLYEVAKAIILGTDWSKYGLSEIRVSGGDLAPDPRYLPENLFARQITFSCLSEFQRKDLESRIRKAWKVAGIHVDRSGSVGDVGGVEAKVTLYGVGNDEEET